MILRFVKRGVVLLIGVFIAGSAWAAGPVPGGAPADVGQKVKVYAQQYGSWTYRCDALATGGLQSVQCQVFQNMGVKNKNRVMPIALLIFTKPSVQADYDVSAIVPLGVELMPGVLLSADRMRAVKKNIDICRVNGCMVMSEPAGELVKEFRRGKQGHLVFVREDGRPFTVNFSLDGYSQAMAALDGGDLPPAVKQ